MLKHFVAAFLLTSLVSTTAYAAGGGGGSSDGGSSSSSSGSIFDSFGSAPEQAPAPAPEVSSSPDTTAALPPATKKKKNKWKEKWGDLGPKYTAAVDLIEAKKYTEAIKVLKALNKPKDPRVLNYIAFSWRKLGKVEKAIPLYYLALNIAPEYTPAHEYLGEAYIQMNDLEKAKAELRVIEKLCGQECEEYQDLAESIQKAAGSS